ncbi:MAG: hypothetical protein HYY02_11965 [Chloroflexi bacterium]|nr:hypothetical protein [Chloroflexota bacterium]
MMGPMGGFGGMGPMGGMGGFGPMGGMGDMGGFDPTAAMEQLPPFFTQFQETCERLAMGLINSRVRTRALIELLEEKGVLGEGDFDQKASAVWERDYETLTQELTDAITGGAATQEQSTEPQEAEAAPPSPPSGTGATAQDYYAEALMGLVDDAVASRVRLRAIIELLESRGVFAPGEFDKKADAIWERDYEELVLEYHRGNF